MHHEKAFRPDRLRRHRLHRPAGGRVPAADLWPWQCGGLGHGRAQPGQARGHAPSDRRAGRTAAAAGRCHRCRLAGRAGAAGAGGDQHGRALPAARRVAAASLRRCGHRLCGPVRRAAMDGPDDRPARSRGALQRRAHRVLLRLRFDPLRPGRGLSAVRGTAPLWPAAAARARPRACDEGRLFRRHDGQRTGHGAGHRPQSRPGARSWPTPLP